MTDKEVYFRHHRNKKILFVVIAMVSVFFVLQTITGMISDGRKKIAIGSKNYTEQIVLGNLLAELIEAQTDYEVERKFFLGGTMPCFEALKTGDLSVYIEYAGSVYLNILGYPPDVVTPEHIFKTIKKDMPAKHGITPLPELGFLNNYEVSVTEDYAEAYALETIDDLALLSDTIVFAPSFEFINREDGLIGMERLYDIKIKNILPMESGLRYAALQSGEADMITTFSTDSAKQTLNLVSLKDTRNAIISQSATPLFNTKAMLDFPDAVKAVKMLENIISAEEMIYMNYLVDVDQQDPKNVARDFLAEKGLL